MDPSDERVEMAPSRPVVLAAAGPNAIETLRQLPRLAAELSVRVAGPFGLVAALHDPSTGAVDSRVFHSDCHWLSDLVYPESAQRDRQQSPTAQQDEKLRSSLTEMIRRLRVERLNLAPEESMRVRVSCYVLVDLAAAGSAPAALRLATLLRRVDPSMEMTGLALTGRTAESQSGPKDAWFDALCELLKALQDEPLLHRLYILDGVDTNKTWLQTLEDMHNLGARFLLHHGLSPYREHLRRNELTRHDPRESFLDVCGSFCCRMLTSDQAPVARGIAARIAREDLTHLERGFLTEERTGELEKCARELTDRVVGIYRRGSQPSADGLNRAEVNAANDQEAIDALKEAIRKVCASTPVLSLRWFLRALRPRLAQLSTSSALASRVEARYRAAEVLDGHREGTYKPVIIWTGIPEATFGPNHGATVPPDWKPQRKISRAADRRLYALGIVLMLAGLVGVGVSLWGFGPAWAMVGGVVACAAPAIMALPCGWQRQPCAVVGADEQVTGELVHYRRYPPTWASWASAGLLMAGVLVTGFALWSANWPGAEAPGLMMLRMLAVVLVLAGLCLIVFLSGRGDWPGDTPRHEHPDGGRPSMHRLTHAKAKLRGPEMSAPPAWGWLVPGLACIGVGWALLWFQSPRGIVVQWEWRFVALVTGLLALLSGISLLCWPWTGHGMLYYQLPKGPKPLKPGIAAPLMRGPLASQVSRWNRWIEAMLAPRGRLASNRLDWPGPRRVGTILDALVRDWDKRLADLFRQHIEEATGTTVAELAEDADAWADCLVGGLVDPAVGLEEPAFLFALHAVSDWLGQNDGAHRLPLEVRPDPEWFESFVTRTCAPRWPTTRAQPEADASVIAVGESLWEILEPLAKPNSRHLLLKVEWQDPQMLVIIRVIQGLKGGWRGFPALPEKAPPRQPDEEGTPNDQQP